MIHVIVLDENDNDPEFENDDYSVTISESTAVGSLVVQLPAIDRDARRSNQTAPSKVSV